MKWYYLWMFIYGGKETASISQFCYFSPPSYFSVCLLSWLLHLTQTSFTNKETAVGQDKREERPSSQTDAGTVERTAGVSDMGKFKAAASTKSASGSELFHGVAQLLCSMPPFLPPQPPLPLHALQVRMFPLFEQFLKSHSFQRILSRCENVGTFPFASPSLTTKLSKQPPVRSSNF